jgi:hypothetical protein
MHVKDKTKRNEQKTTTSLKNTAQDGTRKSEKHNDTVI